MRPIFQVTTAVTSMTRIKEGVFLMERGASPYAGDMLHQPPLLLFLFYPICNAPVTSPQAKFAHIQNLVAGRPRMPSHIPIALGEARYICRCGWERLCSPR
jgi:hypothetical protein